jgi:hypothetical protein
LALHALPLNPELQSHMSAPWGDTLHEPSLEQLTRQLVKSSLLFKRTERVAGDKLDRVNGLIERRVNNKITSAERFNPSGNVTLKILVEASFKLVVINGLVEEVIGVLFGLRLSLDEVVKCVEYLLDQLLDRMVDKDRLVGSSTVVKIAEDIIFVPAISKLFI